MGNGNLNWIANFIWGIADDVLRDVYVRGKYCDVILPMTVIRRLDAVLERTKQVVLAMKQQLDAVVITNQEAAPRQASGQAFYNTSPFTLRDLRARAKAQQLKADFEASLDGFSPNVQEILDKFKFRNQIPTLVEADILGHLIEKFLDSAINLSPEPLLNTDGSVRLAALDNHAMGTIFEELIRRFNEENNEEADEHFTPRDVVRLMADLIFLPIAEQIESGTHLVYDGACGTGGMLTVAEARLAELTCAHGKTARRSPSTSSARRSTPKPTPSPRPTCCWCYPNSGSSGKGGKVLGRQIRTVPSCSRERAPRRRIFTWAPHSRRTASQPASSTSCSPIRLTARAGRPTSIAWAAMLASRIRASSSSTPATRSSPSSPAPATASSCSW
jgi:HsdM N-terminal domain/N-6 DNA Methylase